MTQYSSFKTNFTGSTSIMDILSSTSDSITMSSYPNFGSMTGNYIYLGNLLIQFTNTIVPLSDPINFFMQEYNLYYPIEYDDKPYMILTTPLSSGGNTNITVISWTRQYATLQPGVNQCTSMLTIIGPRPASSY